MNPQEPHSHFPAAAEVKSAKAIVARDLWKSFDHGQTPVLQGVSLEISRGEMVALWGSSGSGKSTLLHLLSGLERPDRGEVFILGLDPAGEETRLQLYRRSIGFVFQLHNLIPDLTLLENLRIPCLAAGRPPKEADARARHLAEKVGLSHRLASRIQTLSGGERQRTAICRALMNQPQVIFADEPTGALDEKTADLVFELLLRLVAEEGASVILATHERRFAEGCRRVLRVHQGQALPL
ncbi:ABC transporter ATP-binding protein [Methylacidimicrobium sp. B4]|uniref:ABC transporter ATP-binding protein n=1 Tax=Methylacidimicrobium sp. B4 TaxID=2796139 RepID=UPI001A8DBA3D|nr:ABC transporter ATP-binding protein [Methylacidimicrobium sp. B4]QSR85583.1 ABC transporter ATP-binding protein [Methylacidimicrobium sp. B4]